MKYENNEKVCLWDRVKLGGDKRGIVVFSVDNDQYSSLFPKEQWSYLEHGVMIDTTFGGLVHFPENDGDLELLCRGDVPSPEEWASLRKVQFDTAISEWKNGTGESVQIGYVNKNGQMVTEAHLAPITYNGRTAWSAECAGMCMAVMAPTCMKGAAPSASVVQMEILFENDAYTR